MSSPLRVRYSLVGGKASLGGDVVRWSLLSAVLLSVVLFQQKGKVLLDVHAADVALTRVKACVVQGLLRAWFQAHGRSHNE
jgi:hypothetical protein